MDDEYIERRSELREKSLRHTVHVRVMSSGRTVLGGSIRNLSDTGAMIVGDTEGLALEQKIKVVLMLPMNRQMVYGAIVRHIQPDQFFGVTFEDDQQQQEAVTEEHAHDDHLAAASTCVESSIVR